MENTRPILYGVADYAELRKRNGWFIDRTAKIRDLEATHYAVFLRPRRFGKSLLLSILEGYYDIERADRFDELFAGTDIGANPTDERYTGAPMLRWFDGVYYYFHLDGSYERGFNTRVVRSRDLRDWEMSPHVVLDYDVEDKLIHPLAEFTAAERMEIASAKDVNVSDLDMCEWVGKLVCFYSWGDQRGNEFSALAEADCTEKEFCESFFL